MLYPGTDLEWIFFLEGCAPPWRTFSKKYANCQLNTVRPAPSVPVMSCVTLQLPSSEQKMNAPKSQTPSPVCLSTHTILDKAAEPQEMRSHPASRHRPLGAERSTFAVKMFSEERDDTASWARLTIVDETRRYKIAPMASVRTGVLERLTFRKAAGDPEDVLPRETVWTLKG